MRRHQFGPVLRSHAQLGEHGRFGPGAQAEFEPPAREHLQHGRVLGQAKGRLGRQHHHRCAETDAVRSPGQSREEQQRRRKPTRHDAGRFGEVVLRHPRRVKPDLFHRDQLGQGVAQQVGGRPIRTQVGEEADGRHGRHRRSRGQMAG